MIVRTDDREIENELVAMQKVIIGNGGWIHPGFIAEYSSDTGLSVYMQGSGLPAEYIIKLPEDVLIPADLINLSVNGGEFVVAPDTDSLSLTQLEIIKHMISIYNLTDKVEFHKNECPWIKFRKAPELIDQLLCARTKVDSTKKKQDGMHGKDVYDTFEDLVAETFIASRILRYKGERDGPGQARQVIMPVIDCFNHDYRGSVFLPESDNNERRYLNIRCQELSKSSQECYAFYGMYDGLDMFLDYGFYDRKAPFVRSVPLEFSIEGVGEIVVNSYPNSKGKTEPSKELGRLQNYMPIVSKTGDGKFELSYLFITVDQLSDALRQVLFMIIRSIAGNGRLQNLVEQTKYCEEIIVTANIEFYRSFLRRLDDSTAAPELVSEVRQVAEFQLAKLYKYDSGDVFYTKIKELIQ